MEIKKIKGLVAAVATPMKENGGINLDAIDKYAEFLIGRGVGGAFVCGTTGEGMLMDSTERKAVAERWMKYSDRLDILVHVGSTSCTIARDLAEHAGKIGARAISAMGPCFLQPSRAKELVEFDRIIAEAAPDTPFYYYHIPETSGVNVNMLEYIKAAEKAIPTFSGIKYTSYNTCEMLDCIKYGSGKYDILHGHDETLLAGLQVGAQGGIGTTYNVTSPAFLKILAAFKDEKFAEAADLQYEVNKVITVMCKYVNCIVGVKAMLDIMGVECGPCRLPIRNLDAEERKALEKEFKQLEYIIE